MSWIELRSCAALQSDDETKSRASVDIAGGNAGIALKI